MWPLYLLDICCLQWNSAKTKIRRTLGELFFFLIDEMADITFRRSLCILMDALMASLQEILKLSDKQLTAFTVDFEARLPEYLRNALHPEVAIAIKHYFVS